MRQKDLMTNKLKYWEKHIQTLKYVKIKPQF